MMKRIESLVERAGRLVELAWRAVTGLGHDKLLHFGAAACMASVLKYALGPGALFVVMTLVFVTKEVYDAASGRGRAEWGDLLADYAGYLVGVL